MQSKRKSTTTGIVVRHSRSCGSRNGARCNCKPTYQANVWIARDGKRRFQTFRSHAEAKGWRADAQSAVRRGELRATTRLTVETAAEDFLKGAHAGTIRAKGGVLYKPSVLRSYEGALRNRLIPDLGPVLLRDIHRVDLQDYAERLLADGLNPSTVRNTLMPLRAIFRRALIRGDIHVNPAAALELPAVRSERTHVASLTQAEALIAALEPVDRALWATAFYAGLRRGELFALRWEDVDLEKNTIRVERSWDERAGYVEPKSQRGRRAVPVPATLRRHLIEQRLLTGRSAGLVFGTTAEAPCTASNIWRRARRSWTAAGLEPVGLHQARHTYASFAIAARVNAKALSTYMGHASITTTFDRYGHLMDGNESEAGALLDTYFAPTTSGADVASGTGG